MIAALTESTDKEIHLHLNIDGREIGNVVAAQMEKNPDLVDATRRALN